MDKTDRYRLISDAIAASDADADNLRTFVLHRCAVSWRTIAWSIWDYTGFKVTDVTLARWFENDAEIQQARQPAKETT